MSADLAMDEATSDGTVAPAFSKKRKRSNKESPAFHSYINRLLSTDELEELDASSYSVSKEAKTLLSDMVEYLVAQTMQKSSAVLKYQKSNTLNNKCVTAALETVLTGDVMRKAVCKGTAASETLRKHEAENNEGTQAEGRQAEDADE